MLFLGCVFHECMSVVYAFIIHVNVYMLLCMHCHGYGYACIVGEISIVMFMCHHDAIGML